MSDSLSLGELHRLISNQKQQIENLEKRVHAAEKQAEAAEQYSRQDCLILRGKLNVRSNYNFRDEVMRLIEFHTGVRFPSWCINTTHWLGGGNSIIVRFNNKAVRDDIYRNRVPKQAEKRGLFIHESLTASKMTLVARCAALRKEGKVATYYTQGGNVLVKKAKNSPSILVTTNMTKEDIKSKLYNQPGTYSEAVLQVAHEGRTEQANVQVLQTEEVHASEDRPQESHQAQPEEAADIRKEEEEIRQAESTERSLSCNTMMSETIQGEEGATGLHKVNKDKKQEEEASARKDTSFKRKEEMQNTSLSSQSAEQCAHDKSQEDSDKGSLSDSTESEGIGRARDVDSKKEKDEVRKGKSQKTKGEVPHENKKEGEDDNVSQTESPRHRISKRRKKAQQRSK